MTSAPLRWLAMLVVTALLLTLVAAPSEADEPSDDPSAVCDEDAIGDGQFGGEGGVHGFAIECLWSTGIVVGLADGTFGAEQPLRRDQTATIIVRFIEVALGEPLEEAPPTFEDVAATSTHASAIGALQALDIVQGRSDTVFDPAGTVTRGQLASIVARMLDVLDDGEANGSFPPAAQQTFDDVVGSVHAENIAALAALGVIQGTGDGLFEPLAPVTRGQASTMFTNAAVVSAGLGVWAPAAEDAADPDEDNGSAPPPGGNGGPSNQPPTVESIDDDRASEGKSFELEVEASDPDGDDLEYSATGLPAGLSIDDGTGIISGEPAADTSLASPYEISVTVDDGTDAVTTGFNLTVVILRDDFDRADLGDDWNLDGGNWSTDGDVLSTTSTGILMWGDELSTDVREQGYYLEARVRKDGTNGIGLVAGRTEVGTGTHVFPHLFQNSQARLGRFNSTYSALDDADFPNAYGEWFVVRVEMRGVAATMYVDGEVVASSGNIGYDPGGWVGLRAVVGDGTSFDFDWVEAGALDPPPPPPASFAPDTLLASESFDTDDADGWPSQWDTRLYGTGGSFSVEDDRGVLRAEASGVIDLYAANNDPAANVDDGYQTLVVDYDGTTRGGAALVFRHDDTDATDTQQPDSYRLFWLLPNSPTADDGGLWIRHSKDGTKTTLASSTAWDGADPGLYVIEGGMQGNHIKVRVRPIDDEPRAADDWDLEYTHTGSDFLETGRTGIFTYMENAAGKEWRVGAWNLYELAD